MRAIIKNIIKQEEVSLLPQDKVTLLSSVKGTPTMSKILNKIQNVYSFKLHPKSYCRMEPHKLATQGVPWHLDTGGRPKTPEECNAHMSWCVLGATILLPGDFSGGDLKYRKNGIVEVIKNRQPLDLYLHTSDEEHMVDPSDGDRKVFLLFI